IEDINKIKLLNNKITENLKQYENVYINSTQNSIPHILNVSIIGVKPETMLHALEEDNIYISTQSACSSGNTSKAVMAVTNNEERAKSSIRISLSKKTTEEDVNSFLKSFQKNYQRLELNK
ncbi:MAG: aminotransferase class V-fold PLP-dependent enzyme, partial [Bacilli bacterium]|nr:aminotransferase class V-fold PLP-dependent enzyme [Bacilli bacterium]